ncbi:MAG: hypothetical protein U0228_29055 [Myxococcaceae bacterium]
MIEFVEVLPAHPKIGDVATVRFRLLDSRGVPLAGTNVDFKLQSTNTGVNLSPTSAPSIKGSGFAETQIVASGRVNSVIVVATAGDKSVNSAPITFAGTVPSGRQLSFQCGPIAGTGSGGRHAIGAWDQARSMIVGDAIDCTAHVADRNGDGISGALVSFLTEAGTIGPSETSQSNLVGNASVIYKTSLPAPIEVSPGQFTWMTAGVDPTNTGDYIAPLWMHPFNWTQNPLIATTAYTGDEPRRPDPIRKDVNGQRMENNPRDNLVSMIAVTSGEEGYTDTNNNGQYDMGEDFDDLTEPFVDSNDNGTWDAFERFIDTNGNRQWDGKNGKFDPNTLIWIQEKLLWTGIPATEDMITVVPGVNGHKPVFAPACPEGMACAGGIVPPVTLTCPGTGTCSAAGPPVKLLAYLADPWFNALAKNGDADGCGIAAADMSPVKVNSSGLNGFAFTYPPGERLGFLLTDARDPLAPPINQIPPRRPPIDFVATITCNYTSSPKDGYVVKIVVGTIKGTIE